MRIKVRPILKYADPLTVAHIRCRIEDDEIPSNVTFRLHLQVFLYLPPRKSVPKEWRWLKWLLCLHLKEVIITRYKANPTFNLPDMFNAEAHFVTKKPTVERGLILAPIFRHTSSPHGTQPSCSSLANISSRGPGVLSLMRSRIVSGFLE